MALDWELHRRLAIAAVEENAASALAPDRFPPPAAELAGAHRVAGTEVDLDVGMYASEIFCRLQRYSRYRGVRFRLLFCDREGAWAFIR